MRGLVFHIWKTFLNVAFVRKSSVKKSWSRKNMSVALGGGGYNQYIYIIDYRLLSATGVYSNIRNNILLVPPGIPLPDKGMHQVTIIVPMGHNFSSPELDSFDCKSKIWGFRSDVS